MCKSNLKKAKRIINSCDVNKVLLKDKSEEPGRDHKEVFSSVFRETILNVQMTANVCDVMIKGRCQVN